MHAVVVRVNVSDVSASKSVLNEQVVPNVKQAPGARFGVWTAPPGANSGEGVSVVVFDSEPQAKQAADMVRGGMPDGVQLISVEVREVVASF